VLSAVVPFGQPRVHPGPGVEVRPYVIRRVGIREGGLTSARKLRHRQPMSTVALTATPFVLGRKGFPTTPIPPPIGGQGGTVRGREGKEAGGKAKDSVGCRGPLPPPHLRQRTVRNDLLTMVFESGQVVAILRGSARDSGGREGTSTRETPNTTGLGARAWVRPGRVVANF